METRIGRSFGVFIVRGFHPSLMAAIN